jgi:G3E family GTPase
MNKHEFVTEREYDECLDHVYTLNENTPVIKTYESKNLAVDPDLVFGLDTRLFQTLKEDKYMIDGYVDDHDHHHHSREIDMIHLERNDHGELSSDKLEKILRDCPANEVYRVKGFVKLAGQGMCILNFAFGRWELVPLTRAAKEGESGLRLTVMLARGEGCQWKREFEKRFEGDNIQIDYHPA